MSRTITDVIEFTSPVTVVDDGEAANSANLGQDAQKLANRTAYLDDLVEGTGAGVKRVQSVITLAALKALTPNDLDFEVWSGEGLFQYSAVATTTSDDLNVITPDSGVGRWLRCDRGQRDVANGVAGLDANGRLKDSERVWGNVTCGASPVLNAGSGIAGGGLSTSAAGLTVTLAVARSSVNYVVHAQSLSGAPRFVVVTITDTTHFTIAIYDSAGAQVHLDSTTEPICFEVLGG